jgi:site-specific recombinase XerD
VIPNRRGGANKGKPYPPEPLTPAEVAALLDQCSIRSATGCRNRAMITMLYRSGLRVSELLALRPSDVNLAQHSLRLLDTKTGEPQTRGFHPSADDSLARWMERRRELGHRSGPLFCTLTDGGPMHATYVRLMLKRLATHAGIEKRVHPHGLRHTFAAELDAAGVSLSVISKLLGHHSVPTTARYLDHLTNRQAVSALQGIALPQLEAWNPEGD